MRFIQTFDFLALINTAVCLAAAFAFGTLIGAERQYRQRSAGLRINVLVAVGAAGFVDFGVRLTGPASTQVMAYVVSGIDALEKLPGVQHATWESSAQTRWRLRVRRVSRMFS